MQLPIELKQAIDNNAFCAIATKINEKEVQNHLMWVDYREDRILINTEQGRKKTKNIRQEPNISVVIFHPNDMYTSWELRGVVETIVQSSSKNSPANCIWSLGSWAIIDSHSFFFQNPLQNHQ